MKTRCEIIYGKYGIHLSITGNDLELYALAKKLDDLAHLSEEIITEESRYIKIEIEESLENKVVKNETEIDED